MSLIQDNENTSQFMMQPVVQSARYLVKKKSAFFNSMTQGSQLSINPELPEPRAGKQGSTSINELGTIPSRQHIMRRHTQRRTGGPLTLRMQDSQHSTVQGSISSPFNGDKRTPQSHRLHKKGITIDTQKNIKNSHQSAIFNHLANIRHAKQQTIFEIFTTFCENIQTTIRVKNERFVITLINKYGSYNPRIKEFVNMFTLKPGQWQAEYLLRTMIQNQAEQHNRIGLGDGFKKFKFEPAIIDAVIEVTRRLEEALIILQEDRYHQMAQSLINQNYAVNTKQNFVKGQMIETKRTQQLHYLNEMIRNKKQLNLRVLETDICEKIMNQEEKSGRFTLISGLTRNASIGLDSVVHRIKLNPEIFE